MKKTSLYLDPALDEALAKRAADEGLSKAEFMRRALAGAVIRPSRPKPKGIGIIKDGPTDMSVNAEKYMDGFGE